jgi:protein-S-isoprenylcysteine O-methyltransferase Ste14
MFKNISRRRFLQNYLSTMSFILIGWYICFYVSTFHRGILTNSLPTPGLSEIGLSLQQLLRNWFSADIDLSMMLGILTIKTVFEILIIVYAVVLVGFYQKYPWLHSKVFVALRGLWLGLARPGEYSPQRAKGKSKRKFRVKPRLSKKTGQALLTMLLKFFYAPLMINWCLGHIHEMTTGIFHVIQDVGFEKSGRLLFDSSLFMASFQTILFVDTFLYTLGYIIETPSLKNRIVSVEPTFFGWFICLACYPPWNEATGMFALFHWQSHDFPHFDNDTLHLFFNTGILVLMAIYSWASVAMGFRASNLTNRGIVTSGPYRFVRHPAYAAKNTAWWIGAFPTFYMAFSNNLSAGLYSVACTAAWSFIYIMRAITEERHLRLANNGYAEYAHKVRYRFIPGVI